MSSKKRYVRRAICSMLFLAIGILVICLHLQANAVQPEPVSVHLLTSEEVEGRYISISSLRVTPGFVDPLYVEVPLADGTTMKMMFSGSSQQKTTLLYLQQKKDLEYGVGPDGVAPGGERPFLSVDYTGVCQGATFHNGALPPACLREYLAIGVLLAGVGIVGLFFALLNLLRKPKIVPLSEMQSVYSPHQLEKVWKAPPVYPDLWLSESAMLMMKNQKLTQVNFCDITGLELEMMALNHIRTYSLKITTPFEKVVYTPHFESKDIALALAQYLMTMAPRAELGASLKKLQPAALIQCAQGGEPWMWDAALRQQYTRKLIQNIQKAEHRHKKERLYAFATMGILVTWLILLGGTGILLPNVLRSMFLAREVDAVRLLDAIRYSVIIPLVVCVILSIGLIMLVVHCVRRSGSYAKAGALISLLLGGIAMLIGFMGLLSDVGIPEIRNAAADKRQIQRGELTETDVYICGSGHTDVATLIGSTDEIGYRVSRLSGVSINASCDPATSYYYFPYAVDLSPYGNTGYLAQASSEENKNATVFRICHTENWQIIVDIEVVEK